MEMATGTNRKPDGDENNQSCAVTFESRVRIQPIISSFKFVSEGNTFKRRRHDFYIQPQDVRRFVVGHLKIITTIAADVNYYTRRIVPKCTARALHTTNTERVISHANMLRMIWGIIDITPPKPRLCGFER